MTRDELASVVLPSTVHAVHEIILLVIYSRSCLKRYLNLLNGYHPEINMKKPAQSHGKVLLLVSLFLCTATVATYTLLPHRPLLTIQLLAKTSQFATEPQEDFWTNPPSASSIGHHNCPLLHGRESLASLRHHP